MIGRINHVAMVVPDLVAAVAQWRNLLGADISVPTILENHGVCIAFVRSVNCQVELMEPYGENSSIAGFCSATLKAACIIFVMRSMI